MDATTAIRKFQEFFEASYHTELVEKIRKAEKFCNVDFKELSKHDPDLAEELIENPEEAIKAAEIAIEQFDLEGDVKNFKVRFFNLPESVGQMIRNIRSVHLKKLISIKGIIRQKSDVRPQVTAARFECPSCGNIMNIIQVDIKFKEPTTCGCGRKGKFRLLSKELVDAQKIVMEEAPEELEGGDQPKRLDIFLKSDLVSPMSERKTNPGGKVMVNGILMEVAIPSKDGGKLTRFDLMLEANFVQPIEEDFFQISINEKEEEKIKAMAKDPLLVTNLVASLAPTIYGHDKIKEALILQIVGGVRKSKNAGSSSRGDLHILLIGDPGAGKSQLLKRVSNIVPKARYVSGKGASGAGLTASVIKDEFIRGWVLEAGALVLANRGLCCIDELDKMSKEDRSAMHEALEQQTVSISKANIQATLRCETTVLAAANPKFGRFDPYEMIAKQIDLPPPLLSRFDLIFPIRDLPDQEKDAKTAHFILKMHQAKQKIESIYNEQELRKYFSYIRQNAQPTVSDEAIDEIEDYYVKMRNSGTNGEGQAPSVAITPRQLEALIRLAEASAKLRLAETVTKEDAKRAIELVNHCLHQIGVDPQTGKIDIDRISSGISASERGHISQIKEIINELSAKMGNQIPVEDVLVAASQKGIKETQVMEVIEKLNRSGDLFTPKKGIIQKL